MNFYETFIHPIAQNQVVTGLSFTALLAAVGYQLRQVPHAIDFAVRRAVVVSLTVTSTDPAFAWIERWLAAQPYAREAKAVSLRSYTEDGDIARYSSAGDSWALSPGEGLHWFRWGRNFIWLTRRNNAPNGTTPGAAQQFESITLNTFGRSQAALRAIVQEARLAAKASEVVTVRLWRGYWAPVRGKYPRALKTVILAEGQAERIVEVLRRFESSGEDYAARGVPWRLGCLFKGPPGTGKTSFVLALAAHFRRPICVLNLGSVANDDALFAAVMDAPPDAIVLIEDIDCAGSSRVRGRKSSAPAPAVTESIARDDEQEGVTKAGLLNALDGITTPDGRIFVMTTNHPELLDPALIRPGRADLIEDFQYLGSEAQGRMAALYYGAGAFRPVDEAQSPAAMQAAFMRHPDDANAARAELLTSNMELAEAAD